MLVCHPDDVAWFSDTRVLPDLTRTSGAGTDHRTLQLVTSPSLDPGLAFLDAPDIDSVVAANRRLAAQLLAAADLWLFVTTAARYADAVPWDVLETAHERGTALAVVLDRVPPGAEDDITAHLGEMLAAHGLAEAPLFVVPETTCQDGLLPEPVVAPLRSWFSELARDAEQRAAVVRRTLDGALDSLRPRTAGLVAQAHAQLDAAARLRADAQEAYAGALAEVDEGMRDGSLLRGEVLARWQEFVGTGELLRTLQDRVGRLRDRLTAAVTGRPRPGAELTAALESGVVLLVTAAAERAAERTAASWRGNAAGTALLRGAAASTAGDGRLDRAGPELRDGVERTVRDWQGAVLDLVRREGAARRTTARVAAYGVNATGLVVMIAVFASTAFIPTGAEIGVAGGTTVLSQKVLEALFGDQAVRRLAAAARADLLERVGTLLDGEQARFAALLAAHGTDPADVTALERRRGRLSRRPDERPRARPAGGTASAVRPTPPRPSRPGCARSTGSSSWARAGSTRRCSPRPARCRAGPGSGCGSRATTPSSRWPAPPAAASRRCSTRWPGRRSRPPGCAARPPVSRTPWSGAPPAPARCWTGWRSRGGTRWTCRTAQHDLRGLVLLDLPDHDSTEVAHRLEVDRLVELVDVLVWVLDPQKYADAAIHDRYLRPLARHAEVMVVVLNQVDRLPPDAVPEARGRRAAAAGRGRARRRAGAAHLGRHRGRAGPAARRADRRRRRAPGGPAPGRPPIWTPWPRTWRRWWAGRPATGSARARSRRSSPRWPRPPASPRSAPPCSGRRCTARWPPRASRSPAGCAGCARTRCAGCTWTGAASRP